MPVLSPRTPDTHLGTPFREEASPISELDPRGSRKGVMGKVGLPSHGTHAAV